MLRQIANIFPREDQQQLGVDGLDGGAPFAEAPTAEIAGVPVAAGHQRALADLLFIELAAEEHRVQIAAVEPVLFTVQRLADDVMHLRVVAADSQVDMVVQHAVQLLRRGADNQFDMHMGKFVAEAAQNHRQRERRFGLNGVERRDAQGAAVLPFEQRRLPLQLIEFAQYADRLL